MSVKNAATRSSPRQAEACEYKGGLEPKVAKMLGAHKISFQYEPDTIEFEVRKKGRYKPDFKIYTKSGTWFYLEVKGWFRPEDREKMKHFKETHGDNIDVRLYFAADNKLSAKTKMKYSDWCRKHGYKYTIGKLPKDWLK